MSKLTEKVVRAMQEAGVKEWKGVVYRQNFYRAAAGEADKLHLVPRIEGDYYLDVTSITVVSVDTLRSFSVTERIESASSEDDMS